MRPSGTARHGDPPPPGCPQGSDGAAREVLAPRLLVMVT